MIAQGYQAQGLEGTLGLPGSGLTRRRIAQGYMAQGIERNDSSGLPSSRPKGRRIAQGYEA